MTDYMETVLATSNGSDLGTTTPVPVYRGPPGGEEIMKLTQLQLTLTKYVTPIAVFLGLILNVLLIFTARTTRLKHAVFSVVLVCVGSGNIGYLFVYFLSWLQTLPPKYHVIQYPGVCQLFMYAGNIFNFLPNWYLLAVLAERCRALLIIYLQKPPHCKFRVRLYLFIVTCLPFFIYIVSLWATASQEYLPGMRYCLTKKKYGRMYQTFMKADTWLTLVFPLVGIVLLFPFNLIFFLVQSYRTRHIRQGRDRNHSIAIAYRDERWYTISVVFVVIVHFALTIPKDRILLKNIQSEPTMKERSLSQIYTVLSHMTRVTQPFIFIIVNKALRRRLRDVFLRRKSCNRSP